MRSLEGKSAQKIADHADWARRENADLRAIALDVRSAESVEAAVRTVTADAGRIDVIVHNVGHMVHGPLEAFTPEQLAARYDAGDARLRAAHLLQGSRWR